MTIYSFSYLEPVCCSMSSSNLLPDLHAGFPRGRSGGLVFPSLSESSTVYCGPCSQRLWRRYTQPLCLVLEPTVAQCNTRQNTTQCSEANSPQTRRNKRWTLFFFLLLFLKHNFTITFICFCPCWAFAVAQAFSSCSEWGQLFFGVCGLLIVVVSLVAEHRL